jgi:hypothetical protein
MDFLQFKPFEFTANDIGSTNSTNPFIINNDSTTFTSPISSGSNDSEMKEREDTHIKHLNIHHSILMRLDEFISKNQIPHIIFHGPSGSGKQTIVRQFIQRIYGGDKIKLKTHVMTVNCSHGKGIQFIREELKFFAKANAQTKSNIDGGKSSEFKVIMLLNAHHLTVDAQSALRRCIELFSYNTRFFIVVENKDKLLNPILSRFCDIFVPQPKLTPNSNSINLHQYVLSQQFQNIHDELLRGNMDERLTEIRRLMMHDDGKLILRPLMETVNALYESGISCLDLMAWVKTQHEIWSKTEYSRAVMRFYQIKPQFRCEKLLMLFMCNYLLTNKRNNI